MARRPLRYGTVAEFADRAGLGVVLASDDGRRFPFHCTAIADGSRTIEVGRQIVFDVTAAGGGRWEATAVTGVAATGPSGSP